MHMIDKENHFRCYFCDGTGYEMVVHTNFFQNLFSLVTNTYKKQTCHWCKGMCVDIERMAVEVNDSWSKRSHIDTLMEHRVSDLENTVFSKKTKKEK